MQTFVNTVIRELDPDKAFTIGSLVVIAVVFLLVAGLVYGFLTSDFARKKIFHQEIETINRRLPKPENEDNKKTDDDDKEV